MSDHIGPAVAAEVARRAQHPYADHPAALVIHDHIAAIGTRAATSRAVCECRCWRGFVCDYPAHLAEMLDQAGMLDGAEAPDQRMTDLAPLPSPVVAASVQRRPGRLPVLMAELREELRGALADLSSHNPAPPPSARRGGALPGLHWETGITVCPQHYAKPVTVIVLDEEAPGLDLIALQGVDCAFPTDIKTITARDARTLANALLAAADAAERR